MKSIGRREFLAGVAGAAAWPWFASHALASASSASKQRALILLWLDGGASHLETFDPKPFAPTEVRGPFSSTAGVREDLQICERLPRVAALLDRCVLLRGISSGEGNHDRAATFLLTGHPPSGVLTHPGWPCWIDPDLSFDPEAPLPRYIALPTAPNASRSGFLAAPRGPVEMAIDLQRACLALLYLEARTSIDASLDLRNALDALDGAPRSEAEATRDRFRLQALALSRSKAARDAFDLKLETAADRTRYGSHFAGQALLAARRLIERGTRAVLVNWTGWDHHRDIGKELGYGFPAKLDALDQALSALYLDLERRAMLDRVVVAVATEFGRTPRINLQGGRDHWPRASSALLFGAGLKRGVVHGATDARGEEPLEDGIAPSRIGATLLRALGVDPTHEVMAPSGRPIALVAKNASPLLDVLT